MPLTITPERYAAIREKVSQRRADKLAAEITPADWSDQPQFADVDDFMNFADTFIEHSDTRSPRSRKRR